MNLMFRARAFAFATLGTFLRSVIATSYHHFLSMMLGDSVSEIDAFELEDRIYNKHQPHVSTTSHRNMLYQPLRELRALEEDPRDLDHAKLPGQQGEYGGPMLESMPFLSQPHHHSDIRETCVAPCMHLHFTVWLQWPSGVEIGWIQEVLKSPCPPTTRGQVQRDPHGRPGLDRTD